VPSKGKDKNKKDRSIVGVVFCGGGGKGGVGGGGGWGVGGGGGGFGLLCGGGGGGGGGCVGGCVVGGRGVGCLWVRWDGEAVKRGHRVEGGGEERWGRVALRGRENEAGCI